MGSPKSISLLKGNVQWPDPQDDPALTPDQRTELRAPNFLFRVDGGRSGSNGFGTSHGKLT